MINQVSMTIVVALSMLMVTLIDSGQSINDTFVTGGDFGQIVLSRFQLSMINGHIGGRQRVINGSATPPTVSINQLYQIELMSPMINQLNVSISAEKINDSNTTVIHRFTVKNVAINQPLMMVELINDYIDNIDDDIDDQDNDQQHLHLSNASIIINYVWTVKNLNFKIFIENKAPSVGEDSNYYFTGKIQFTYRESVEFDYEFELKLNKSILEHGFDFSRNPFATFCPLIQLEHSLRSNVADLIDFRSKIEHICNSSNSGNELLITIDSKSKILPHLNLKLNQIFDFIKGYEQMKMYNPFVQIFVEGDWQNMNFFNHKSTYNKMALIALKQLNQLIQMKFSRQKILGDFYDYLRFTYESKNYRGNQNQDETDTVAKIRQSKLVTIEVLKQFIQDTLECINIFATFATLALTRFEDYLRQTSDQYIPPLFNDYQSTLIIMESITIAIVASLIYMLLKLINNLLNYPLTKATIKWTLMALISYNLYKSITHILHSKSIENEFLF